MNRPYNRKVIGILFLVVVLLLMLSVLTPTLGIINKTSVKVDTNNYGYGYGYGYGYSPPTSGYWGNHPESWPVDIIMIGGIIYKN